MLIHWLGVEVGIFLVVLFCLLFCLLFCFCFVLSCVLEEKKRELVSVSWKPQPRLVCFYSRYNDIFLCNQNFHNHNALHNHSSDNDIPCFLMVMVMVTVIVIVIVMVMVIVKRGVRAVLFGSLLILLVLPVLLELLLFFSWEPFSHYCVDRFLYRFDDPSSHFHCRVSSRLELLLLLLFSWEPSSHYCVDRFLSRLDDPSSHFHCRVSSRREFFPVSRLFRLLCCLFGWVRRRRRCRCRRRRLSRSRCHSRSLFSHLSS